MGYEGRLAAAADYVREKAHELFSDGDFDDDIVERILNGDFDDAVIKRMKKIEEQK